MDTIFRHAFDAQALAKEFPPQVRDAKKRILFELAGSDFSGSVEVSRWQGALPASLVTGVPRVDIVEDAFQYGTSDAATWHVNFADPQLFVAYGSALFAQDEMQVAEHPILGSVREALLHRAKTDPSARPLTEESGEPTPILVRGAERRIAFDFDSGLYGGAFQRASEDAIRRAVKKISPTITNVLAMAAPAGGRGRYTAAQIALALRTAYVGFSAVGREGGTIVHTGHWGCGAFGGNRVMMAMIQMLAATTARVSLVFHTVAPMHTPPVQEAFERVPAITGIADLEALALTWGTPDGN